MHCGAARNSARRSESMAIAARPTHCLAAAGGPGLPCRVPEAASQWRLLECGPW
jgi:hypothetical protein